MNSYDSLGLIWVQTYPECENIIQILNELWELNI